MTATTVDWVWFLDGRHRLYCTLPNNYAIKIGSADNSNITVGMTLTSVYWLWFLGGHHSYGTLAKKYETVTRISVNSNITVWQRRQSIDSDNPTIFTVLYSIENLCNYNWDFGKLEHLSRLIVISRWSSLLRYCAGILYDCNWEYSLIVYRLTDRYLGVGRAERCRTCRFRRRTRTPVFRAK